MTVKHFSDLIVWQKAMDLAELVYRTSGCFPRDERYGLTDQLKRAVVSIPSNKAEGQGRNTTKEFLYFLSVAKGSLQEVQTLVFLSRRIGFIDEHQQRELVNLITDVARLLNALKNSLRLTTNH